MDDGSEAPADGPVAAGRRLSRRAVLRAGTLGALATGIITSVPGVSGLLAEAPSAASEVPAATEDTSGALGPVVAHITDAATGDISLYVGEREIAYRDPALVQHLLRAAR